VIRFGLNVPTSSAPGADPVALAVTAERLGYDFVSCSDHPCGSDPSFETWTLLTHLAARTSTIGIASRVLGVPYRPPAMLAKMAETLDRLSGGRLILGLGGGYSDDEHRAFGLGVRTPAEKVTGMEEAVRIMHGLWSQERFSFAGRLYHTDEAQIAPRPDRHIPIWLGTFGPRALRVTGRLADGWIPTLGHATAAELVTMRARVLDAAATAGRDPTEITCALNLEARVTEGPATAADDVLEGTAEAIAERLGAFAADGFSAFNLMVSGPNAAEQAEALARGVLPLLRDA
jgi:alkanesulfonate monooxygenase SsuD/methylene tetrahydromethanopterin reductase-like flavin-dependent oxidoreductase (luciferase family)